MTQENAAIASEAEQFSKVTPSLRTYEQIVCKVGGGQDHVIYVDIDDLCLALNVWSLQKPQYKEGHDDIFKGLTLYAQEIRREENQRRQAERAAAFRMPPPSLKPVPVPPRWWQVWKR